MGVFSGRGAQIDVLAISMEMRQAVRQWETCRILILNPGPRDQNFINRSASAFVWSGMARVQPYRREISVAVPTDSTVTQSVRFQVDFSKDGSVPLLRHGYQVICLTAAQGNQTQPDPNLSDYVHIINSPMNSSLAWIRTIETMTNVERRNDFEIELSDDGEIQWVTPDPDPDPDPDPEP